MGSIQIDLSALPDGDTPNSTVEQAFKVGDEVFAVSGLDSRQTEVMFSHYERAPGDISTSDRVIKISTFQNLPEGLSATLDIPPGEHVIEHAVHNVQLLGHGIFADALLGSKLSGRLFVHKDADSFFQWGLENLLRILTAYRAFIEGGFVLHSAGIVLDGAGYLFYGFSGAGKSTLSRQILEEGGEILSDDLNLVAKEQGDWYLQRMPFTGELENRQCYSDKVPLRGIFRLRKGDTTRMRRTTPGQAAASLLTCMPYLNKDPRRADLALDRALDLLNNVDYGEIYWRRGPVIEWLKDNLV